MLEITFLSIFLVFFSYEKQRNLVGYDEDQPRALENELVLEDAIADLPVVSINTLLEVLM